MNSAQPPQSDVLNTLHSNVQRRLYKLHKCFLIIVFRHPFVLIN